MLEALIDALLFDPCWEVRQAAAWAIFGQRAYTPEALLALYVSSKVDPHYQVRYKSAEALDLLTLCRKACYKDLYASADKLIVELKAKKYKAGDKDARRNFGLALAAVPPSAGGPGLPPLPVFPPGGGRPVGEGGPPPGEGGPFSPGGPAPRPGTRPEQNGTLLAPEVLAPPAPVPQPTSPYRTLPTPR